MWYKSVFGLSLHREGLQTLGLCREELSGLNLHGEELHNLNQWRRIRVAQSESVSRDESVLGSFETNSIHPVCNFPQIFHRFLQVFSTDPKTDRLYHRVALTVISCPMPRLWRLKLFSYPQG